VVIREHDEDPSSFPGDFFTHDDVYYVRILDDPLLDDPENLPPDSTEKLMDDQRRGFVYRLLSRLADLDHVAYQKVLLEAVSIMPAEVEEEVYRLRNVRMAEKGFLPFDEAVGIYQPVAPETLDDQPAKNFGGGEDGDDTAAPQYPVKLLQKGTPFSDALQEIAAPLLLQRIQTEFVAMCNQVIAADQEKIQDREALRAMVDKVCGYLNIGLVAGTPGEGTAPDLRAAGMAALIERLPLSHIFRAGYGRALDLKWRVARWRETAWFEKTGLPLPFWGETWMGVLGGLVVEKPLYFDNYRTGRSLYREFRSLEEVGETDRTVTDILAVDDLLAAMSVDCGKGAGHLLTWQSLLLTLWARGHLNLDDDDRGRWAPIPKAAFKTFLKALFAHGEDSDAPLPARTEKSMKIDFLNWLSDRSGEPPDQITRRLGGVLEGLFDRVDGELGAVRPGDIDPKHIHLFRVA
jgi:hypothetical protein